MGSLVSAQHVSDQSQLIRVLVGEIETLREKRRALYADKPHELLKRFTQEELTDSCCPSYKNLLYRYTQRLPSRLQILQIADYLECTLQERNDLLLAAQYLPEEVDLRDDQYRAALDHAHLMLGMLPFPAYIILREWIMGTANAHFLQMVGMEHIEQIDKPQRTPVHTVFDKTLPIRQILEQNADIYKANVRLGIMLFSTYNQRYQREFWFQNSLEKYHQLADFSIYWHERAVAPPELPETYAAKDQNTGELTHLRPIMIPVTLAAYPVIHALVPTNASVNIPWVNSASI